MNEKLEKIKANVRKNCEKPEVVNAVYILTVLVGMCSAGLLIKNRRLLRSVKKLTDLQRKEDLLGHFDVLREILSPSHIQYLKDSGGVVLMSNSHEKVAVCLLQ